MLGLFRQDETLEILGVPQDKGWTLSAAISAGYPAGRWGLAKRKPAHEVAYADRWGQDVGFTLDGPLWNEY